MFAVTGATGHLGRLVVASLLERVAPKEVVALVRSPEKAAALAEKGVQVRAFDYSKPESLAGALAGVDRLLLISSSELGQRATQHQSVIDAAKQAGVKFVAYTSILRGGDSPLALGREHGATERALAASGLPHALLRNGWYLENYTWNLKPALTHGTFIGSAGQGRIAAASRADFAAAAAAVLTGQGHEGKVYELAGDESFSMAELAAEVSKQLGRTIGYADMPAEQYRGALLGAGLPPPVADLFTDADVNIAKGALDERSRTLSRLIGRPTTSLAVAVADGLALASR